MHDDIQARLADYVSRDILRKPKRTILSDEALLTSGLIDSFHLVDLGMFVEDTFGVRIEDFELNANTFDTLGQLAALIESRME